MRIRLLPLAIAALLAALSPAAWSQEPPSEPAPPATQSQEEARDEAQDEAQARDPAAGTDALDVPLDDAREDSRAVAASDDPDAVSAASRVPLDEIRRYVSVFNVIREGYVDPVEDKALMMSSIRGLLNDLDPHSAYMEKEAAEAFQEGTDGAYAGIGVEVMQLPDGKIRVIAPIDGTPAERAGILAGDVIIAVDGRDLEASDNDGHGPLRGEPGSKTMLTVLREGEVEPLRIEVQREIIRITSVRTRMLEPGYAYVRVAAFQADTASDFSAGLERLRDEAGGRLEGVVIDLRSNPGGLLTAAVQIADDLLEKGSIVSTRGRMGVSDAEFNATPGDSLDGAPVVVIVDAGSASASEVLAAALRDNGRARIVGSRTFGKGSVQTLVPLDNGDSVKLTTARYYTPDGKSIQARGIDPDVVLKPEGDARSAYTEATLPGHLRGDEEGQVGAGDVLPGEGPITAALAELKQPGATAVATPETAGPPRD